MMMRVGQLTRNRMLRRSAHRTVAALTVDLNARITASNDNLWVPKTRPGTLTWGCALS